MLGLHCNAGLCIRYTDSFVLFADQEIIDTFDRAEYRQSGSSLDSNNEHKKKKNNKMFKGFGMFK